MAAAFTLAGTAHTSTFNGIQTTIVVLQEGGAEIAQIGARDGTAEASVKGKYLEPAVLALQASLNNVKHIDGFIDNSEICGKLKVAHTPAVLVCQCDRVIYYHWRS